MKELTEQEAYQKAAAICAAAENCKADIMLKLQKWGVTNEMAEQVLNRLIENNFIDEARYARCFVSDKFRYNKWGRLKIRQALRAKKISDNMIEDALSAIGEESYDQMIKSLIRAKVKTLKGERNYEYRCKILRYVAGRGFEPEYISRQIAQVLQCEEDDNDIW